MRAWGKRGDSRRALAAAGVTAAEIDRRVLCLDSKGLILKDRPGLSGHILFGCDRLGFLGAYN